MLNMLKDKIKTFCQVLGYTRLQALAAIAESELYDSYEDYLDDLLGYHDKLKLAMWLSYED